MTQEELFERAHELIGRFDNIKFVGPGWSGNVRQGFMFNPELVASSGAGSSGGGGPPPGTGACCFTDGSCVIYTGVYCSVAGGTYQGNGTICDPNPCPQPATGACCFSNGRCIIETAAECATAGGVYSGDGTLCSPNTCPPTSCPTWSTTVAITFSGISVSCGCFNVIGIAFWDITDVSVNGAFTLSGPAGGPWTGVGGVAHYKKYLSSCSGTPLEEGDTDTSVISLSCVTGGFLLTYNVHVPGSNARSFLMFTDTSSGYPLTLTDTHSCGVAQRGTSGTAVLSFS